MIETKDLLKGFRVDRTSEWLKWEGNVLHIDSSGKTRQLAKWFVCRRTKI